MNYQQFPQGAQQFPQGAQQFNPNMVNQLGAKPFQPTKKPSE